MIIKVDRECVENLFEPQDVNPGCEAHCQEHGTCLPGRPLQRWVYTIGILYAPPAN